MKTTVLLIVLFTALSVSSFSMDRNKLKIVQTLIDSAKTQEDLNIASRELFNIWNEEVSKKEKELCRFIPKESSKKLRKAMRNWRIHVEEMSTIRSNLFRRDILEPRYYRFRGIQSKLDAVKNARKMQGYVYNMSKAIYYEDKWIELDVLLNTK
jgi:hypothetical protein